MVADFRNVNRKKGSKRVKPDDLIKLSFDEKKIESVVIPMTEKEMKQMFGSKFKKNGN